MTLHLWLTGASKPVCHDEARRGPTARQYLPGELCEECLAERWRTTAQTKWQLSLAGPCPHQHATDQEHGWVCDDCGAAMESD